MKTSDVNQPGENTHAIVRGHKGRIRAGTPGPTFSDAQGNDITAPEAQFIGASVTGEDGEIAIITINGTGQQGTNSSGATLEYGDVVVIDTDGSLILTTTAQDTRPVGIIQLGGIDTDPVSAVFAGYVAQVNSTGTVTSGDYLQTSTSAGDAESSGTTRQTGSFGIALADGPNPPAYLFGIPDSSPAIVTGDYVLTYNGGEERVEAIGNLGASETIDLANGNWQRGTLNADCTFTFTGATNGLGCSFTLFLTEDGTGGWSPTWPGSVAWIGGTTPTHDTTASTTSVYVFLSYDGGTTWYGTQAGGGGSSSTTRWELAVIPGSPPDSLYAAGDWLYIEVPV